MQHQALTGILTEQKLISDCRYRVIESSSLVPVLFREVFSHPYISFFHLLVNNFSVIREYGSTLYVGMARAISPTNTNFRLTFLLTRLQEALYEDLAVQSIKFDSLLSLFWPLILSGSQFLEPVKNRQFLRFIHTNNNHNNNHNHNNILQTDFLGVY